MKNHRAAVRLLKRSGPAIAGLLIGGLVLLAPPRPAVAATVQNNSAVGVQGVIPSPPPSRGGTIAVPGNGASFTSGTITVSGLCPTGLLVKVFDNNVFVGSVICSNGSYSLQINLFNGQNELVTRVYDALDQPGPDSGTTTVTFTDAQFAQFGTQVTLSSVYAERGAAPGTELDWPILLSGGSSPYALSVDWGDGSPSDLMSLVNTGTVTIKHTYKSAGVYNVVVKATDANGQAAFLQLVGQATGAIQSNKGGSSILVKKQVLWWPTTSMIPLIFIAFWIGRSYQIHALRKKFESVD